MKSMNKILCYIYDGMADFEISLLLHQLRNAGEREIVSVSDDKSTLTAQSGLKYIPDKTIADLNGLQDYEALIIPGGPINNDQNGICPVAAEMIEQGKLVAAICFAPQFLGKAGILNRYSYTTSCSAKKIEELGCQDPFDRDHYVDARCVVDRNLITAQGYAFVDFAEAVCNYLKIFKDEQQRYERLGRVKESV